MKIVIFGGFLDYQAQLSKALNKTDDSIVVVYTMDKELPEEFRDLSNVKIRLLSRSGPLYDPRVLVKFLLESRKLVKELRQYGPDVVHFQIGASMLAFFMPFMGKAAIVSTFHDVIPHKGDTKFWERYTHVYIRKKSLRLFVHGRYLKQSMIDMFGVSPDKVCAIPIGPHNIEPFKRYENPGLAEDGNLVMFFGRIVEYKGLEYLIRAEPYIAKEMPGTKVVIAGVGEDIRKYEDMMANKDRFVIYNHYIPYKLGADLLRRCSVIVLPYVEASQSGVVCTAYGFKKPVVVTDVGAIPEIVDHGGTGLIVPAKDPLALADAVVMLLKDEKLRKRMGENAYKKLETDLSWDNIASITIREYANAIREHRSRGIANKKEGDIPDAHHEPAL